MAVLTNNKLGAFKELKELKYTNVFQISQNLSSSRSRLNVAKALQPDDFVYRSS